MRAVFALLFIAACATAPAASPAQRVAGCWISHAADSSAVTMRWLPDASRPGALQGDKLTYLNGETAPERYRLEPRGQAWALCQIEADGERCWQVAEGQEGSLEGGRAFIDAHREGLRISIVGDGVDRIVFEGARDGCD